ncbi:MAG TPA: TonB family protein [Albitalea sp.]|nr:TonB family protein [Albitalea sp.]
MSPSPCAYRRTRFKSVAASTLLVALFSGARAETATPAPAPSGDLSPTERAQRDADRVFQWIRIHADKPRKTTPVREEKAQAVAPAAKPAAKPVAKATATATATDASTAATANRAAEPSPAKPVANTQADAALLASIAPPPAVVPEPDAPLVPIVRTEPSFPGNLMRLLRKGMVQVSFTVEPDGSVTQAQAVTTTNPRLNQAALATVAQWRFQPLRHAQQAVVDLGFNLD